MKDKAGTIIKNIGGRVYFHTEGRKPLLLGIINKKLRQLGCGRRRNEVGPSGYALPVALLEKATVFDTVVIHDDSGQFRVPVDTWLQEGKKDGQKGLKQLIHLPFISMEKFKLTQREAYKHK